MSGKTVLLIGASGLFGSRLARNLMTIDGLHLILLSRGKARLDELKRRLLAEKSSARISSLVFDHRFGLQQILGQLRPWLVIDASGPFQSRDYRIPRAALAANSHFIDLADARNYLKGFAEALNDEATARGLVALSGVSSTPTLSAAVVASLTEDWQRIDTIDISIAPDGRNYAGPAATAGVLSYAGKPVPVFRYGAMTFTSGWLKSRVIAIPNLGRRRVAPVETSDAEFLPARHRVTSRVSFSAGLESWLEQWALIFLAKLRQWRVLPSLSPLVPWLTAARSLTRLFCGSRGGMHVGITGLNSHGRWTQSTWLLIAKHGDGPNVPTLPAVAAVRMLLEERLKAGARIAADEIPLAAIEAEFAPLAIETEHSEKTSESSLFENVLGRAAYARLPKAVQRLHDPCAPPVWHGLASVEAGQSFAARLIRGIFGLPNTAAEVPITVSIERNLDNNEIWTRNFNGRRFHSVLGRGASKAVSESFGLFSFILPIEPTSHGLSFPVRRWQFLGVPMPRFLLPKSIAHEYQDAEGRFRFDVRLELPFLGLLVHYKGWLRPASQTNSLLTATQLPVDAEFLV